MSLTTILCLLAIAFLIVVWSIIRDLTYHCTHDHDFHPPHGVTHARLDSLLSGRCNRCGWPLLDVILQKTWIGAMILVIVGIVLMLCKVALWLSSLAVVNIAHGGTTLKGMFGFGVKKYDPDGIK